MDGNPVFTVHATAHAFRAAKPLIEGYVVTTTYLMLRKLFDGFDVVLKVIMIIFICGMFK